MNKQYLMLNLESDTFKGMKADFDELLQQLLENAGAVSLPNTYLEYDEDLGEFVLKPCSGEQDMFAEQETEADEATVDVKAIPQDCHRPLQLRDPMCNDCANRDTSACDHCDGCDKWEPTVK